MKHVSCLFSWQTKRERSGLHDALQTHCHPASARAALLLVSLSDLQTAGFFLLTSRICSSILLMKTVSWEQHPLLTGHSFKPFFSALILMLTYTHFHSDFLHANLNIFYECLLCKQTKLHSSWVSRFSLKHFRFMKSDTDVFLPVCQLVKDHHG